VLLGFYHVPIAHTQIIGHSLHLCLFEKALERKNKKNLELKK